MNFKKLYVDNFFLKSLEKICVQEDWLSPDNSNLITINYLKKKTLLYLTIFEQIDSPSLLFIEKDCSKLIESGLICEKSELFNSKQSVFERENSLGKGSKYYSIINQIKFTAQKLIKLNRWKIIDQHYIPASVSSNKTISGYTLSSDFDFAIDKGDNELEIKRPDLIDLKDTIETTRYTLEELLFTSIFQQEPIASGFTPRLSTYSNNNIELVEKAIYIVRTNLKDEILYLPDPNNLSDVIKMRKHPSIKRFRSVLSEWAHYLQQGESKLEIKARKDIKKANWEMKTLEKWKKYESSSINFWFNSIGGHIPILSNILSLVFMVGGLLNKRVQNKSKWIMIGKM